MIVLLDNIRSALNVGAILRTCDALGIKEVYLAGITPDIENPKLKKTALGAEASVKAKSVPNALATVRDLKNQGHKIVALELTADAQPVSPEEDTQKLVLVIGNEVSGIDEDILTLSDEKIMIEMKGVKESLNVSVAFGIAAYILTH